MSSFITEKIAPAPDTALNGTGYLFVDKSEMLLTHTHLFPPIDLKHQTLPNQHRMRDRLWVRHHIGRKKRRTA